MRLQNRVSPFGDLLAVPARGALFGNRGGRFHADAQTLTARRWVSRRWICCVLDFKGRQRDVWGRLYTELFFLNEPTALAAMKLKNDAQTTAHFGRSTRVETMVAIELAASCKPLRKSNARATATNPMRRGSARVVVCMGGGIGLRRRRVVIGSHGKVPETRANFRETAADPTITAKNVAAERI